MFELLINSMINVANTKVSRFFPYKQVYLLKSDSILLN